MVNYNNGKIYRIVCNKTGLCYVGSTTYDTLKQRLWAHQCAFRKWKIDNTINKCTSVYIMENEDYDIVLIENVNCNSRDELYRRERYWIEHMECVNRVIPTRTHAEYRETHREQLNEFNHTYYEENKEKEIERAKAYRERNPDKIKAQNKRACEKEPTLCECGMYYSYKHKARHLASKKHLNNL